MCNVRVTFIFRSARNRFSEFSTGVPVEPSIRRHDIIFSISTPSQNSSAWCFSFDNGDKQYACQRKER
jgi:hypothetical protein